MRKEVMEAIDLLYQNDTLTEGEKSRQKRRLLFFEALGIEDDGRRNPCMTQEEFDSFDKPVVDGKYKLPKLIGKTTVHIFFRFEAYHDVDYEYCFEDDVVYENRFYVGD